MSLLLPVNELVLTDEFIVVHIGNKINVYRESAEQFKHLT